ncbi:hypothetical protein PVAP13_7NG002989 [Panicum virgatum]|uniref:Uncharacterized protein n=1 Tax=Panicum virgatum TaxID=38727 RepID=A0A8T0PVY3_PANVG|nr:hypothetical protein PVAP13_7NG002989 [Panicum virgatum]
MLNFISQLMQRYVMLLSFPKVYHLFDLSKETRKRKHMKMKSRSFNRLQRRPKPLLNFTTTKKVVYAR